MAHTLQKRYSALVLAKLRNELMLKDGIVFNNDYQGDPKAGAVKVPKRDGEVTVANYSTVNGASVTEGATAYVNIPINFDVAVNEVIDGYAAEAVPDNLIADRLDSAGYALATKIDTEGGTVLLADGKKHGLELVESDNIYNLVVDIGVYMTKAKIPNDGKRYLLVTPDVYGIMLKDKDHFIRQGDLSQQILATGAIGQYAGFNVYVWNDSTANLRFIAGHPRFATRINEWQVPVSLVDLAGSSTYIGASAVQGRFVFDHAVLRADGVNVCYGPTLLTVTAEADAGSLNKTKFSAGVSGTTYLYALNSDARAVYGEEATAAMDKWTSFTYNGTDIVANENDIIEVVAVDASNKVVAVGYARGVEERDA